MMNVTSFMHTRREWMRCCALLPMALAVAGALTSTAAPDAFAAAGAAVAAEPWPAQARHPRLLPGSEAGRDALRARIAQDAALAAKLAAIKAKVQPYVDRHGGDPAWIVSRLQMYWQSKATQVFVKDSLYHHASGTAPVPTVRFTGGRDTATAYATPRLEDVKPYMGENDLLYLQNKASGQWEWVHQAKTGRIIEAINMRIAELARDAAFLYWYTGDEAYAKFAGDIFNTYVTGMAYREAPQDMNAAHDGTIVGMQSYEVIHEDIVGPLAETYDFMPGYLQGNAAIYDKAFGKWADQILANGVPWNNWNLIKARFVLQIASVLGPERASHYVRAVIDGSGARQWPLKRLLDYGYDSQTGIWNESPSYSINVVNDYLECLELLERLFGIDLMPHMPVLDKAVMALPQYLLPNGRVAGFGDTGYERVRTNAVENMLAYARHHGGDVRRYERLLAALRAAGGQSEAAPGAGAGVQGLFARPAPAINGVAGADVREFQTPVFYAPNVSWLIQRNGDSAPGGRDTAMVVSQVGSMGNHAHANGIAMELYAHGVSIAPESGRGSGYLQNDHLQYYAQFPAHNTVVVDGSSTYPSMKTGHPFKVDAAYPAPGAAAEFPWATFSDVAFTEPATDARQRRVLGTVRLGGNSGYFVDIFRSRRSDGQDKYHDYIYHGVGQGMAFSDTSGKPLAPQPSQRLSFADGDMFGYDFWSNRQSLASRQPLLARFDLTLPDRAVTTHMWLQGGPQREFFSVQAPPSTAWKAGMLPNGIDKLPSPTLVIRQTGEAWTHPFSAVMEATRDGAARQVLAVEEVAPQPGALGLKVTATGDRVQTVMSNDSGSGVYQHGDKRLAGRYGIVAEQGGKLEYLFLGNGAAIAGAGYALSARQGQMSAALWRRNGKWVYTGSGAARLKVPADGWPAALALKVDGKELRVPARALHEAGRRYKVFELPAMAAAELQ
jgi:hypothetical protein